MELTILVPNWLHLVTLHIRPAIRSAIECYSFAGFKFFLLQLDFISVD